VLDAAIAAGVRRIIYVSTANIFGNTRGQQPDESFRRDETLGFLSWYDETKYRAHQAAEKRMAAGAPIIIALPSGVYGPKDHSESGAQIELAYKGKLSWSAFKSLGIAWVHVDDLAAGIVTVLDRGRVGELYILSGDPRRLGESVAAAARLGGHKPPRLTLPTRLLRVIAPVNDMLGGVLGFPANARETIRASDGVTYWASRAKATRELGFQPRDLEHGIRDSWGPPAGVANPDATARD